jgi:hypothetical protein
MDPDGVLALCHAHAAAEATFDADRVLATLVREPRYEFFPLAASLAGRSNVEWFYRHQYPRFFAHVAGYELIDEWSNERAALQEYRIDVRGDDDRVVTYRVMSMMPVDEPTGLLTGERLYCDDGFVRALLGTLYDEIRSLTAGG